MSAQNILGWEPTGEPDEVITDYARVGRLGQNETEGDDS